MMKALNDKEILKRYLLFLLHFTVLLVCTITCYFFYLKTGGTQSKKITERKEKFDVIFEKRHSFTIIVDSLNARLQTFNTNQPVNEHVLKEIILDLKNKAQADLDTLKKDGDEEYYLLYEKVINNVDMVLDHKLAYSNAIKEYKTQEDAFKRCRQDDIKADEELAKKNED